MSSRPIDAIGNSALAGSSARARGIEDRNSAVRTTHEAMRHVVRVNIRTRDCTGVGETTEDPNDGSLPRARARARNTKRRDTAVRSAQKAV